MKAPAPSPPKSGGKRARTRQALIDAAVALVGEKGFANLSMEAVAARAGVSRGSIYGNFRDRNDLMMAVAMDRAPPISPGPMPGATLLEQMQAMGREVAKAAKQRRATAVHRAAYLMNVLSDETLRKRHVAREREVRRYAAEGWEQHSKPADPLPMPTDQYLRILTALTEGLLIAHYQNPEDYDEAVIVAAYEALARSLRPPSIDAVEEGGSERGSEHRLK